jgi:hypothetical protein
MHDLASRLAHRPQITTDGHQPYVRAIEDAFGSRVDYAQLVKVYAQPRDENGEVRYSPAPCIEVRPRVIAGQPDLSHVSTSYCERQNLTMRMNIRRFTRLTNAFSRKVENHKHAVALHFFNYNMCRIHGALRVTPAMASGVADRVWSLEDLVGLLN